MTTFFSGIGGSGMSALAILAAAQEHGIPIVHRAAALAEIFHAGRGIAIGVLVYATAVFCIVRAIPVVWDGRKYFVPTWDGRS